MYRLRLFFTIILAATGYLPYAVRAQAQSFPNKPIRLLVPFSAGSTSDILARLVGQKFTAVWGQQVVIDNRAGAGGVIASQTLATANADGHTLILVSASHAIAPALYKNLPYHIATDFAGVSLVADVSNLLVVNNALGAKTVKDLIAIAKNKPGQLNFSSSGIGAGTHLSAELFKSLAGINTEHVPFKGVPESITETITGRVHYSFPPISNALPFVRDGKIRALSISGKKRSAQLPEIPTIAEAALPQYAFTTWYAMLAPAKTPRPVMEKLSAQVKHALEASDTAAMLAKLSIDPVSTTPGATDAFVKAEHAKFVKLVREAGITVQQ
ncbi:MAG: tripartite tricarboxylate transporter substrate binding protein [Burkholderiales bacterium]